MSYFQTFYRTQECATAVDHVICNRRTRKVLGHLDAPAFIPPGFREQVEEAIQVAGWAPFHYPANRIHQRHQLDSCVPWRFYALDQQGCLTLAHCLLEKQAGSISPESTIVRMLAAAGTLVLATWLPEPDTHRQAKQVNEEHLAAAAAAIQNLLLASEARCIQTYWSSGGALASSECFELCGIPSNQKLLGAIFMFPRLQSADAEIHEGKLRGRRGTPDSWRAWVSPNHIEERAAA